MIKSQNGVGFTVRMPVTHMTDSELEATAGGTGSYHTPIYDLRYYSVQYNTSSLTFSRTFAETAANNNKTTAVLCAALRKTLASAPNPAVPASLLGLTDWLLPSQS